MDEEQVATDTVENEDLEDATSTSNVADANDADSDVIDADVIDGDASTEVATDGTDQAAAFLSLEELIKNHVESIDKLRVELKKQKEMFDDSFGNNPTYREHNERVKDATKARTQVKSQITKQPSVAQLDQKIKDMRFDMAELNKTLSDLLHDYQQQTGANQIEMRDGNILEIVSVSKLVRKK